ncbi:FAR-17a/AIG1-like protein [Spinellus fusiger]|nr:FAR-17a/AIG1-like protein [Spinellus fusiger]
MFASLDTGFGGQFKFLTIIGLYLSILNFSLKIIHFLGLGEFKSFFKTMTPIVTAVEGFITFSYWSLKFYSSDMVVRSEVVIPLFWDLSLHLWAGVALYVDFFLLNTEFKRDSSHIAGIYTSTALYYAWISYCNSHNGTWPYPFLEDISEVTRTLVIIFSGTLTVAFYELASHIHKAIHVETHIKDKKKN